MKERLQGDLQGAKLLRESRRKNTRPHSVQMEAVRKVIRREITGRRQHPHGNASLPSDLLDLLGMILTQSWRNQQNDLDAILTR